MKKQLIMIVMTVVLSMSMCLQASDRQSKVELEKFAKKFVYGVCGKVSQVRLESTLLDLEELAYINSDAYISQKEADFKDSQEVKSAFFVVRQGFNKKITVPVAQRAVNISPTLYATSTFMNELDRIYYTESPQVKKLENTINDGSTKSYDRAKHEGKLKRFRSTPSPYQALTSTSTSATSPSYYSSSSTPLFFDNDEQDSPKFFDTSHK